MKRPNYKKGKFFGFTYKADYNYFLNKLSGGSEELFKRKFLKLFDFRNPAIKRREFNLMRDKIYKKLVSKHGEKCQLNLCADCGRQKVFDVDHYIPLSSNKLNKLFRKIKPLPGRKILSQSLGSNDIANFRLACHGCNSFKKHKIII